MVEIKENEIKGRIAEAIVKCMFEDLGFEVIPYGYEYTCPTIAQTNKLIKGDVSMLIRKTPDFIIVDGKRNATFIEVKYRKDGVFKKPQNYPYEEAYIILLTGGGYIGIEQYKNLDDKTKLDGAVFSTGTMNLKNEYKGSFKSLKQVPLFENLDMEIVKEYRQLLIKYMKKNE